MPQTRSHNTVGQWNRLQQDPDPIPSLRGWQLDHPRPFRHTTTFGVHPGPVQVAPDEPRGPEDRARRNPGIYGDENDTGVPVSGSFGTDTMFGGAGVDTMTTGSTSSGKSRGRRGRREVSRIERYIRDQAVRRGINPDVAVKVAKSEGLGGSWQSNVTKNGVREDSFGDFQLKATNGLGALFQKQTGLNVRDKKNRLSMIDFALDYAAQNGWGSWYGAAKSGIGKWTGLKGAQPVGIQTAEAPRAIPEGGLASLFAERPAPQISAGLFGAPQAQATPAMDARAIGSGMFAQPPQASGSANIGIAQTEPDIQRMEREAGMYQPTGAPVAETEADVQRMERDAGMFQPSAAQAAPQRFGGIYGQPSPDRFTPDSTQDMALAHIMGTPPQPADLNPQFSTAAAQPGAFQSPSSTVNKMVDAMMNPKGPAVDTAVAPEQAAEDAAMAAIQGPTGVAPATAAPRPNDISGMTSIYGRPQTTMPELPAAPQGVTFQPKTGVPQTAIDLSPPKTVADMPIASVDDTVEPPGSYPPAPEEEGLYGPRAKRTVQGLLTAGPVGALVGALTGGGLFSGPAGQAHADIDAGTGAQAIESGMYGPRGTFGRSLSTPGAFTVSRGPGQGYDLTNQMGARTTYGPSGDVRANKDTLKAWGNVLGGLFDRPDKKDKDKGPKGLY